MYLADNMKLYIMDRVYTIVIRLCSIKANLLASIKANLLALMIIFAFPKKRQQLELRY